MIIIEIRINKEVRNYQEGIFFGLTLRQCIFSALAILVAVVVYFTLGQVIGNSEIGWVCVLCAFPFALGGFFQYNYMTLEQFLVAVMRTELLLPTRLTFKSDNLYVQMLKQTIYNEGGAHP